MRFEMENHGHDSFAHDISKYTIYPIGLIRTPFKTSADVPIQSAFSNTEGTVEIYEQYQAGLMDIELFSHIILIYWFHRSKPWRPVVTPFRDKEPHGIFAIRGPARPNPLGFSVVRLIRRDGRFLIVKGVDILDGTPLLDLKPYIPEFDHWEDASSGWLGKGNQTKHSNSRFEIDT